MGFGSNSLPVETGIAAATRVAVARARFQQAAIDANKNKPPMMGAALSSATATAATLAATRARKAAGAGLATLPLPGSALNARGY